MLYLNYELFTSDRIIAWFEKNLAQLEMAPKNLKTPSHLSQLKFKLKAAFFEGMDKMTSDEDVLAQLEKDERFTSNYPKLKQVIGVIFSLNDKNNKSEALARLKKIEQTDWNIEGARAKFNELNTKFGYFNPPSEHLYTLFTEMAISCRTMVVLFEKNNTAEDTMAYDYAYKLMALFIDPEHPEQANLATLGKHTHKLVNNIDNDKHHPFHEALLVQLEPLPHADTITDRQGWQKLIQAHGVKAFPFFLMAEQIEQKIARQPGEHQRAPKCTDNLTEAKHMFALCSYSRAEEDSELARLCKHHKASEAMFDACLNYLAEAPGWPKKTTDNLPDLIIQGEGEAEGLYWVKLPVTDKRALILGQITDCCQSITGHSKQCVKDAVSLEDNGLYVLVKQKKKGNPALIESGQINEKDFKIIGQSYGWTSMLGNVCLDSLECLNGEVTDGALQSIMAKFGEEVLKQYPDVNYVTLGRGGKTPRGLFTDAPIPEQMRQGTPYGDSSQQYRIAEAPLRLTEEHESVVNKLFQGYPEDCLDYLKRHVKENDSNRLVATLKTSFDSNSSQGRANQKQSTAHKNSAELILMLLFMHKMGLLNGATRANFSAVLKHKDLPYVARALSTLSDTGLLSGAQGQANFNAVLKHKDPSSVARALSTLSNAGLLSGEQGQANFNVVLKQKYLSQVARTISTLSITGLLSGAQGQANFNVVLKQKDPFYSAFALSTLRNTSLLSGEQGQANFRAVLKQKDPRPVALALSILSDVGLLSGQQGQANRDAVFHHQDPRRACTSLNVLSKAGLLSGEQGQVNFNSMLCFLDVLRETKLDELLQERGMPQDKQLDSLKQIINNIHIKQISSDDKTHIHLEVVNYVKALAEDKNSEIGRLLQARKNPRLDSLLSPIINIEPKKFTAFKKKLGELKTPVPDNKQEENDRANRGQLT